MEKKSKENCGPNVQCDLNCCAERYENLEKMMKDILETRKNRELEIEAAKLKCSTCGSLCDTFETPTDNDGIRLMCNIWNVLKTMPELNVQEIFTEHLKIEENKSVPNKSVLIKELESIETRPCCTKMEDIKRHITKFGTDVNDILPSCLEQSILHEIGGDAVIMSKMEMPKAIMENKPIYDLLETLGSVERKLGTDFLEKLDELKGLEKELKQQVDILETNDRNGANMLKQADGLWSKMEKNYMKALNESKSRIRVAKRQKSELENAYIREKQSLKDMEQKLEKSQKLQMDRENELKLLKINIRCLEQELGPMNEKVIKNRQEIERIKRERQIEKKKFEKESCALNKELKTMDMKLKHFNASRRNKPDKKVIEMRNLLNNLCHTANLVLKLRSYEEIFRAKESIANLEYQELGGYAQNITDANQAQIDSTLKQIDDTENEINRILAGKCLCVECSTSTDTFYYVCRDCRRCKYNTEADVRCVCNAVKCKLVSNMLEYLHSILVREVTEDLDNIAEVVMYDLSVNKNMFSNDTKKILHDYFYNLVKNNRDVCVLGAAAKTKCEVGEKDLAELELCLKSIFVDRPPVVAPEPPPPEPCETLSVPCGCPGGPWRCKCGKNKDISHVEELVTGGPPEDQREGRFTPLLISSSLDATTPTKGKRLKRKSGRTQIKYETRDFKVCGKTKLSAYKLLIEGEKSQKIHREGLKKLIPLISKSSFSNREEVSETRLHTAKSFGQPGSKPWDNSQETLQPFGKSHRKSVKHGTEAEPSNLSSDLQIRRPDSIFKSRKSSRGRETRKPGSESGTDLKSSDTDLTESGKLDIKSHKHTKDSKPNKNKAGGQLKSSKTDSEIQTGKPGDASKASKSETQTDKVESGLKSSKPGSGTKTREPGKPDSDSTLADKIESESKGGKPEKNIRSGESESKQDKARKDTKSGERESKSEKGSVESKSGESDTKFAKTGKETNSGKSESKADKTDKERRTGETESNSDKESKQIKSGRSESKTEPGKEIKYGQSELKADKKGKETKSGESETKADKVSAESKSGESYSKVDKPGAESKTGASESKVDKPGAESKTGASESKVDKPGAERKTGASESKVDKSGKETKSGGSESKVHKPGAESKTGASESKQEKAGKETKTSKSDEKESDSKQIKSGSGTVTSDANKQEKDQKPGQLDSETKTNKAEKSQSESRSRKDSKTGESESKPDKKGRVSKFDESLSKPGKEAKSKTEKSESDSKTIKQGSEFKTSEADSPKGDIKTNKPYSEIKEGKSEKSESESKTGQPSKAVKSSETSKNGSDLKSSKSESEVKSSKADKLEKVSKWFSRLGRDTKSNKPDEQKKESRTSIASKDAKSNKSEKPEIDSKTRLPDSQGKTDKEGIESKSSKTDKSGKEQKTGKADQPNSETKPTTAEKSEGETKISKPGGVAKSSWPESESEFIESGGQTKLRQDISGKESKASQQDSAIKPGRTDKSEKESKTGEERRTNKLVSEGKRSQFDKEEKEIKASKFDSGTEEFQLGKQEIDTKTGRPRSETRTKSELKISKSGRPEKDSKTSTPGSGFKTSKTGSETQFDHSGSEFQYSKFEARTGSAARKLGTKIGQSSSETKLGKPSSEPRSTKPGSQTKSSRLHRESGTADIESDSPDRQSFIGKYRTKTQGAEDKEEEYETGAHFKDSRKKSSTAGKREAKMHLGTRGDKSSKDKDAAEGGTSEADQPLDTCASAKGKSNVCEEDKLTERKRKKTCKEVCISKGAMYEDSVCKEESPLNVRKLCSSICVDKESELESHKAIDNISVKGSDKITQKRSDKGNDKVGGKVSYRGSESDASAKSKSPSSGQSQKGEIESASTKASKTTSVKEQTADSIASSKAEISQKPSSGSKFIKNASVETEGTCENVQPFDEEGNVFTEILGQKIADDLLKTQRIFSESDKRFSMFEDAKLPSKAQKTESCICGDKNRFANKPVKYERGRPVKPESSDERKLAPCGLCGAPRTICPFDLDTGSVDDPRPPRLHCTPQCPHHCNRQNTAKDYAPRQRVFEDYKKICKCAEKPCRDTIDISPDERERMSRRTCIDCKQSAFPKKYRKCSVCDTVLLSRNFRPDNTPTADELRKFLASTRCSNSFKFNHIFCDDDN